MWWPNIDNEIEKVVKKCHVCQINRDNPPAAPVHPWEFPYRPWLRVHIDYAGPFVNKLKMFLVLVDTSSKWLEVEIVDQVNSQVTIERLKRIFVTHGIPDIIVSDNGSAVLHAKGKN